MGALLPGTAPEGHITEARLLSDGRVAVLVGDLDDDEKGAWCAITWASGQVGEGEYDAWLKIANVTKEELAVSVKLKPEGTTDV